MLEETNILIRLLFPSSVQISARLRTGRAPDSKITKPRLTTLMSETIPLQTFKVSPLPDESGKLPVPIL
jgi:hypothetical protein